VLTERGVDAAWVELWEPLFTVGSPRASVERARRMALAQSVDDLVNGVRVFHDRNDCGDVVRALRGPVIAVSGAGDRTPGPAVAAALARDAAAGELRVVDDCGHYVNLERPREWDALLGAVVRRVTVAPG
jgi:pimeloyl-ACP methyl ester carboxylesterase